MKTDKLLAVLDMSSEAEQAVWCEDYADRQWGESLADLAFRLRDEAKYIHRCSFVKAVKMAYSHCLNTKKMPQDDTLWRWFSRETKPIHWIIASLIAKDAKDGK